MSLSVDTVRREVEERIVLRDRIPQSAELHLSPATKQILFYANEESRQLKNRHIGPEHLLLGIVREEKLDRRRDPSPVRPERRGRPRRDSERQSGCQTCCADGSKENSKTPSLQEFTRDLTVEAAEGKLDPLVGRENEIETAHRDPLPPNEEQSGTDRRIRCRQNGDRRRTRPAHRR